MATCKDCIHNYACGEVDVFRLAIMHNNKAEKYCKSFKNKSDYAEVKHGEWKECEGGLFYCCSKCGHLIEYQFSNYCPNCGAKMDGQ